MKDSENFLSPSTADIEARDRILAFSSLQRAMIDASPDCIKLITTDGRLLMMNKAGCRALGVPDDAIAGIAWLPLLPPDVQLLGQEALAQAAAGTASRFPGRSESDEGVRYWDNLLTPMVGFTGSASVIVCVARDISAQVEVERRLEEEINRENLISREMNHRFKNLFSVVLAVTSMAEKEAASSGLPAMALLREKLLALARASQVAFQGDVAGGVDMRDLAEALVEPYRTQFQLDGEPARVTAHILNVLALVLHELTTNAVKYGALSTTEGVVALSWTSARDRLVIDWSEQRGAVGADVPPRQGFGTEMIDRLIKSVRGNFTRSLTRLGMSARIDIPN